MTNKESSPAPTHRLRGLARDWRFWVAAAVALYTIVGFLVVPLIAKRQIVAGVKKSLACDATIASVRFNPYTFNTRIRGFALHDRRGDALAAFDELFINIAPWPLRKRVVALEEIWCKLALEGMD